MAKIATVQGKLARRHRKVARRLKRELEKESPVLTGKLKRSWKVKQTSNGPTFENTAPYSGFVEARKPFIRKAIRRIVGRGKYFRLVFR